MGGRRGAAEEELMARPQLVSPCKGCRGYALGGDDEQEGAQHNRKSGDDALDLAPMLHRLYHEENATFAHYSSVRAKNALGEHKALPDSHTSTSPFVPCGEV